MPNTLLLFKQSKRRLILNSFVKNPVKYSVGGSVESIKKITKEDLYKCYNTFYNPNNMIVVVTGNVKPKEVIEVIKENQEQKELKKMVEIKTKEYKEPDTVDKEFEEIKMNVTIPKLLLSYKFNIEALKDDIDLNYYFSLYGDLKFGATSIIADKLKEQKIITSDIDFTLLKIDNHLLVVFDAETNETEELVNIIKKEFKNFDVKKEDFERKKKAILAACIYMSDNIYSLNNKITNDIIHYNRVINDMYDNIKELDFKKMKKIITNLDFSNIATVIINSK